MLHRRAKSEPDVLKKWQAKILSANTTAADAMVGEDPA